MRVDLGARAGQNRRMKQGLPYVPDGRVIGLLGGSFSNSDTNLQSSLTGNSANPTLEISKFGFRVSSVSSIPEPSAYAAIFGSLALAIAIVRRRGRRTL